MSLSCPRLSWLVLSCWSHHTGPDRHFVADEPAGWSGLHPLKDGRARFFSPRPDFLGELVRSTNERLNQGMTVKARTSTELAALHSKHLEGRTVAQVLVHGINSLKSLDVPLDALVGQSVGPITATSDAMLELVVGEYVLEIDLQRTGVAQWVDDASPWSFGKPSMPTGQLLLESGGGVNFSEPAKTKRITFRLRRPAV